MRDLDRNTLDALEALLGVPVPRAYVEFMTTFPPELAAATYGEHRRRIASQELFDDVRRVLEENREVRRYPTWGRDGASVWPRPHLVIGCDLGGDVIFVDASRDDDAIHRYRVENCGTVRIAEDLPSYARMLTSYDPESKWR